jgi:4-diphosphocytidyl-2-C-methyl-D-erythritol kinase
MEIIKAFAKLTLSLKVLPLIEIGRFKNYHPIDATMISIDLYDELVISDGNSFIVEGEYKSQVPEDNLVSKTLQLLNVEKSVRLVKNIPAQGGLGGGSADAGALIRWALESSNPKVRNSANDLVSDYSEIALKLGADVPFCIHGGYAKVLGVGEKILPMSFESKDFILFILPFGVSTRDVYKNFDLIGSSDEKALNDLFEPALRVDPRLESVVNFIELKFKVTPNLAGSGSTLYYEVDDSLKYKIEEGTYECEVGDIKVIKAHSICY